MTKRPATAPDTAPAEVSARKEYAHTLSLRLTAEEFRRLRLYIVRLEERTGQQASQQEILKTALAEYLTRKEE
jgi:hypothetical protein